MTFCKKQDMNSERYSRQILLDEIGQEGQKKISESRVLLVGAGGLGSPVAMYLCAAGIGRLGIVDGDRVSLSNLQRQILYQENETGLSKAECASARLSKLNSEVNLEIFNCYLDESNAREIMNGYDIIVDGCDNYKTRFIINDICMETGKTYVYGSIEGLDGQVSIFGHLGSAVKSYRDLFDEEELKKTSEPSKAVLGVTAAIVGATQANQVLQIAAGFGEPLMGKLWTINLRNMESYILEI